MYNWELYCFILHPHIPIAMVKYTIPPQYGISVNKCARACVHMPMLEGLGGT